MEAAAAPPVAAPAAAPATLVMTPASIAEPTAPAMVRGNVRALGAQRDAAADIALVRPFAPFYKLGHDCAEISSVEPSFRHNLAQE